MLDQQGSAAAFLLRQSGVNAKAVGLWGSGLLTVDQYDYGHTKPSGTWLRKAKNQIATFNPDVVGVYLNHNYWPPFPHDAAGHTIEDLWSPSGQEMIAQQARALINILRARGAAVFFISPVPAGTISDPDPDAWSAIWHGYLPVLHAMHVGVADSAGPLEDAAGLRVDTRAACDGSQQRVRPPNDLHLTRFGAGRAGTTLAGFFAQLVHAPLRDDAAPGDSTAALVPTRDSRGYWLVGCDGSVYHFGNARPLRGASAAIAGQGGVVAAVRTPSEAGLWLITADGTIASVGDAVLLRFDRQSTGALTSAVATPDGRGILATTDAGVVLAAGDAHTIGDNTGAHAGANIVGIGATRTGRGYWLVNRDGNVSAFGDAPLLGSVDSHALTSPITGIATTNDGRGYWLVNRDGSVFTFGDARFEGTATWHPQPYPYNVLNAPPGPAVGIVATPAPAGGYWIFGTTGRVVARGGAHGYGGDNNLAMLTQ